MLNLIAMVLVILAAIFSAWFTWDLRRTVEKVANGQED